jgi:uncharacterized RDD family membrane protein YckC
MRCPKCQYISYESGGRCRNCGYELSLAADPADLDLPIKTGDEPVGPLADFDLGTHASEDDPVLPARRGGPGRSGERSGEFPLFRAVESEGDAPLVSLPASPRAPVSVRKPSPPAPRPSAPRPEEPELDLESALPFRQGGNEREESRRRPAAAGRATTDSRAEDGSTASASTPARLGAALADLLLLASIDLGVLYLTLRLTGVEFAEMRILPVIPFTAFLAMLNGGYLVVLTVAGGQTLGKMLTGIKVVNADEAQTDRVPLAQAVIRAAALLLSLATAGLGFLPALLAADRRALHDRIARTRVVPA